MQILHIFGESKEEKKKSILFLLLIAFLILGTVLIFSGCVTTRTVRRRVMQARAEASADCAKEGDLQKGRVRNVLESLGKARAEIERLRAMACPDDGIHVWINDVCVNSQGK